MADWMADKLHPQIVQACARIPDQLELYGTHWTHCINSHLSMVGGGTFAP